MSRWAMIVVACGALTVTIAMGVRQAFGIYLPPITEDLQVGRELFSLAIAIQNLLFGIPLLAIVADKVGARWVVLSGGVIYAIGLILVPLIPVASGLYITLGLIVGLALSGTTYVVILGAIAQVVPAERRTMAFGITTAAGSLGMFAFPFVAQWLLDAFGWETAFYGLAIIVASVIVLAFGLPKSPPENDPTSPDFEPESMVQVLTKASKHGGYWLLNMGFFVCGFHVAFIATHLPAFLVEDNSVASWASTAALAMIGLSNVVGSYFFGWLGDIYRKKFLLTLLYGARAVVIAGFLLLPITNTSAIIFGTLIGFLWLATVPLTSGMIAQIFGSRYMATLYGFVFLSHQIGSFLGVWLGGRVYDTTGSYDSVWMAAIALGVLAAVVHLPISDESIRKQPKPAPSI